MPTRIKLQFNKFLARLNAFFFAPGSSAAIDLLRVFLGVAMLKEWMDVGSSLQDLYGRHGVLQESLMVGMGGQGAAAFFRSLSDANFELFLNGFFWLRVAALVTFTLGVIPRASVILLWLMQIFLMCSGEFSSYGIHRYFMVLLFLLVFMPLGRHFTIFRKSHGARTWESTFALRVLQFSILIIYLDAGVSKSFGLHWWNGDAIWRSLHLPEFHRADFFWMASVPFIPKLLGWGTMALESLYILGAWIPGVGIIWTLSVIGMHLGISAFLGLVNFGITLALINVALFVYPWWLARAEHHRKVRT